MPVASLLNLILPTLSNRPQQKFMKNLFITLTLLIGKANFRNMSRLSDYEEHAYSRWYQRDFNFPALNQSLIEINRKPEDTLIAVIDASFIRKSGKHTEGLGMFHSGCAGRALKGLEASGIAIVNVQQNTAHMLHMQQTVDNADESRIALYARHIKSNIDAMRSLAISVMVGDGLYANQKILDETAALSLTLVSKLRRDSDLRHVFNGEQKPRGRKRIYGEKVNFDELSKFEEIAGSELGLADNITAYTGVVITMINKQKIRVVILRDGDKNRVVLFSTDTNMPASDILKFYRARFQIEFCFRDAKQHTGLEHCQSRKAKSIEFHLNASMSALNLLKVEDRLACEHNDPKVISIAQYKRRNYNEKMIDLINHNLAPDPSCQKMAGLFKEIRSFGAIAA